MNLREIRIQAARRRARLFRRFIEGMPRPLRILVLGGAFEMWQRWGITDADRLEIVLMNNHAYDVAHSGKAPFARFVTERIGDVRELRFPHPLAPFFAVWPRRLQAGALSLHRLGSAARSASATEARNRLANYAPLARGDLQAMFPQARIVTE